MINSIQDDDRRRDHHRGRRHHLRRRDRRPVRRRRAGRDQRDRQPAHARGRRAVPGHGREDDHVRRVRLAAARQGRPAARHADPQAAPRPRIENIDEVIHIGDKIQVEIREIDDRGELLAWSRSRW